MYIQEDSSLPFINCIWHAVAERDGVYTDSANEYWCLGFIRHGDDSLSVELYGPSLHPRVLERHAGEEYWGAEFKAYVTLSAISKGEILNAYIRLPVVGTSFLIGGQRYAIPAYGELEKFAQQLQEDGVIVADQHIGRALQGDDTGLSERSRQRRIKSVTGLTKKQIEQLQRARYAFYLLQTGSSLPQAATAAGYADQPHMTRSLRLLRGETPAQIIATHLEKS
jgi:AraC-like DNA-binding protein